MASRWKELKHVQLMEPKDVEEQRRWDEEFRKRAEEIKARTQRSDERRSRNGAKLAEMSARWRSLEQKRTNKSLAYMERLRTSLSMVSSRGNTLSPSTVSTVR